MVSKPPPPERRTHKRVAVVGSGPAGRAAAQQLGRAEHTVIFERDDHIGGFLRYGIPDYKMEKKVIDRRLAQLQEEGVEFRTDSHVGHDPKTEEISDWFDALLLAVGALQGRDLPVPGWELGVVHPAMDYLVQQNRRVAGSPFEGKGITARGKKVVILGGGDTSADCLRNAHREGATSLRVIAHGPKPPESPDPLE